jgi:type III secretion system-like peptide-binding chaperone
MDQIAGIFTRNDIPFSQAKDGSEYRVLYGSTAVFVSARSFGNDLQSSELMNGLELVAHLADTNDDRLQADIGGKTYAELIKTSENQPLET